MSSVAPDPPEDELEPSPFTGDEEPVRPIRPWQPAQPMTQDELDAYLRRPMELRMFNPWACMWNTMAEDGIGYMMGASPVRCQTILADPTKSRYCLAHARQMGQDYYGPAELAEATAKETASNLTRLVPKATKTLEEVMDDAEAPQGVRAKAAAEILDRTGYVRGVDVRIDAQVAVVDVTSIIKERLDTLKQAHLATSGPGGMTVAGETISSSDERADDGRDPDDDGSSV